MGSKDTWIVGGFRTKSLTCKALYGFTEAGTQNSYIETSVK